MTDANGATNFTQQFAINGQRGVEATFAMDGADISDPEMGGSTFSNFNVDAVDEIQSSSGWMPAEIGRGASGFTNIVTRSGASGFHGSVFEFLRNSALDARNYFDHATPVYPGRIPPFRRNEFGFTNGGPVLLPHVYDGRKRTFYFSQYQGFRQALGTTQVMPLPTADQRKGLDSTAYAGDTLTVPVDPGIAAVLKRYPLPNYPAGPYGAYTYATPSTVVTNANQFSVRSITSSVRKISSLRDLTSTTSPVPLPIQTRQPSIPLSASQYIDRQRNVVGTLHSHRFAAPRFRVSSISITRSTPGFPTLDHTDPAVKFNDGLFEAFNSAAGTVMQAYGNLFQGRRTHVYRGQPQPSRLALRCASIATPHISASAPTANTTLAVARPTPLKPFPPQAARTTSHPATRCPTRSPAFSPAALSSTRSPSRRLTSPAEQHIGPAAISRENYNVYLQDTWKVTPRFTLDYGVRWELYTPITERAHRTGRFRFINGAQQYVINPQPGYKTDWNALAPRVQAAWQVNEQALRACRAAQSPPFRPTSGKTTSSPAPRPLPSIRAASPPPHRPSPMALRSPRRSFPGPTHPMGRISSPAARQRPSPPTPSWMSTAMSRIWPRYARAAWSARSTSAASIAALATRRCFTWTLGLERKFGNLTADAAYVGTAAEKLPRYSFPNAYPGARRRLCPATQTSTATAT